MYTYIWIEGYDNLDEFCMKRFGEKPIMLENTGHIRDCTIKKTYKNTDGDPLSDYHQMFFLYMPHEKGKYYLSELDKIRVIWDYARIKEDKTAILKK